MTADMSSGPRPPESGSTPKSTPAAGDPAGSFSPAPQIDYAHVTVGAEPPAPKKSRMVPAALGLVALFGFAGIVWYAYSSGVEDGSGVEIPLVKAETTPEKVKPEAPGGLEVPNQDALVLNRQGSNGADSIQVERLLPEPEVPIPEPEPAQPQAPTAEAAPEAGDAVAELIKRELPLETAAGQPDDVPAAGSIQGETPPEAAVTAANGEAAPAPSPDPPAPSPQVEAHQVTRVAQRKVELSRGALVIQLASVGSNEAARKEWLRLQKAFPDLLGDMRLAVQKAKVKGKDYHRLQTGPFPNRATAEDLCAQLKAKRQDCMVTRR